jgi:hypothetical protein
MDHDRCGTYRLPVYAFLFEQGTYAIEAVEPAKQVSRLDLDCRSCFHGLQVCVQQQV